MKLFPLFLPYLSNMMLWLTSAPWLGFGRSQLGAPLGKPSEFQTPLFYLCFCVSWIVIRSSLFWVYSFCFPTFGNSCYNKNEKHYHITTFGASHPDFRFYLRLVLYHQIVSGRLESFQRFPLHCISGPSPLVFVTWGDHWPQMFCGSRESPGSACVLDLESERGRNEQSFDI